MNHSLAYFLFIKMYKNQLQTTIALYIEHELVLPDEHKRALHQLCLSFVNFLVRQQPHVKLHDNAIEYWVQIHRQTIENGYEQHFSHVLQYALKKVLQDTSHSNEALILHMNADIMAQSVRMLKRWQMNAFTSEETRFHPQLDMLSVDLIQLNGTEELPYLLVRIEEIFHFKRCIFYSYNPWQGEFSGVVGMEMDKIVRMRGKIALEPVFAMKKPVYLKTPAPYVQQVAIELFQLSSIIFIPVMHEEELFGWLSLDQMNEPFDCSMQQLKMYEQIGKRLAMYLSRKQLASKMNYHVELTEKERMVLYLAAEGFSNKEMAAHLFMSEYTVRDYMQQLLTKLQVKNRTQLITVAFRIGLLD